MDSLDLRSAGEDTGKMIAAPFQVRAISIMTLAGAKQEQNLDKNSVQADACYLMMKLG